MFPIVQTFGIGQYTDFVLAFVIGIGFGFALEKAGFGKSTNLAAQFYFTDQRVLKVMFTAIVTAMTGLIVLSSAGLLDLDLVYINPTYLWSGVVGGLIMGVGFIIGGHCPGTALVGAVTGKIDSAFFVLGGLFGMFVFGEMIPIGWLRNFYMLQTDGFSGRLTLYDWLGVRPGVVGGVVILMALAMFWAAEWAEKKFAPKPAEAPVEEVKEQEPVLV